MRYYSVSSRTSGGDQGLDLVKSFLGRPPSAKKPQRRQNSLDYNVENFQAKQ